MRKAHLLLFGCMQYGSMVSGQDCTTIDYITQQFAVRMDPAVLYGTAERYDGGTDTLRMDIYKPMGDGAATRPLLVAIHGGAFVGGSRDDMDELCRWYAARGYVAATVSYRLGFHPPEGLPVPYTYDEAEVVRAAYRATQDLKGAVRFLRGRHEQDSTSTENVFLYGVSAGGITALQVAYATDEVEKPTSCGAIGPVGAPTFTPRPDLGPIAGTLNLGPDAGVKACVSYLGAMLDTTHIGSAADPALFMYHQNGDPVVGCGYQQGLWGMPLGLSTNYPWLYGSCVIDPRMQHLGFTADRHEYHPYAGSEHDIHDIPLVDGMAAAFLARQFCPLSTEVTVPNATDLIEVYPVPATDRVHVRHLGPGVPQLTLLALDGRLLRSVRGVSVEVQGLPPGTYVLVADDGVRRIAHRVQVAN